MLQVHLFIGYSDFLFEITVHALDCSGRSKAVRLGLSFYTHFNYKDLLYVSCTCKINQCLVAKVVYSFISYCEFIYEMIVHVTHYSGRSKAV